MSWADDVGRLVDSGFSQFQEPVLYLPAGSTDPPLALIGIFGQLPDLIDVSAESLIQSVNPLIDLRAVDVPPNGPQIRDTVTIRGRNFEIFSVRGPDDSGVCSCVLKGALRVTLATDTGGLFNAEGISAVGVPTATFDAVHPRVLIVDLVLARLRACVADPKRVGSDPQAPFQSRPNQRELPALNVFAGAETSADFSKTSTLDRTFTLVVDVLASGPNAVRMKDQIAFVVENILAREGFDTPALDELAISVTLTSTDPSFPQGGQELFCSTRLEFAVNYQTEFGSLPTLE